MSCSAVAVPADTATMNESVIIVVNDDTGAVFVDQEMMRQFLNSELNTTLSVVRLCGGKDSLDVNMTVEEFCSSALHEKLSLSDIVKKINGVPTDDVKEKPSNRQELNAEVTQKAEGGIQPQDAVDLVQEGLSTSAELTSNGVSLLTSEPCLMEVLAGESSNVDPTDPSYCAIQDVIDAVVESSRNFSVSLVVEQAPEEPTPVQKKRLNKQGTSERKRERKKSVKPAESPKPEDVPQATEEPKKTPNRVTALRKEAQMKIQIVEPPKKVYTPSSKLKLKPPVKPIDIQPVEATKTPEVTLAEPPQTPNSEGSDLRRPKRERKVPKHLIQDFEQFEGTPEYLKKLISSSSAVNQSLTDQGPALADEPAAVVEVTAVDLNVSGDNLPYKDKPSEAEVEEEDGTSDDDPNKLWCICRKPHNNRFMICCDKCEDWFHGHCVGVTRAMGRELEENGLEWICPPCARLERLQDNSQSGAPVDDPIPAEEKPSESSQKCMQSTCTKQAAAGSIYCSDSCISSHIHESLIFLSKVKSTPENSSNPSITDSTSSSEFGALTTPATAKSKTTAAKPKRILHKLPADIHVAVRQINTGKILGNADAPTVGKLNSWLQKNPTYEIIKPECDTAAENPTASVTKTTVPSQTDQVSSPKKESTNSNPKSKKAISNEEASRRSVRTSLKGAISSRCKGCDDVKVTEEEAASVAAEIEKALYLHFAKEVGSKYKAKYRSLLFNLKDPKNEGLFRRIVHKEIKPGDLAKMTVDDLASKELSEWRQRETEHELKVIERTETDLANLCKKYNLVKTHKGEAVTDNGPESKSEARESAAPAAESLSLMLQDTTQKHRTHLFDLNCRICTGQAREEDVFPPNSGATSKRKENAKTAQRKELHGKHKKNQKELPKASETRTSKEEHGEKVEPAGVRQAASVTTPKDPADHKLYPAVLWEGSIKSNETGMFKVHAFEMSPDGELSDIGIPPTVEVIGRIRSDMLWDYVDQIRKVGTRDIVVVNLEPHGEAERTNFEAFLTYMHESNRCGVIGPISPLIKDFYIVPVPVKSPVPALLPLLVRHHLALEEPRKDLLLGVVVRAKLRRPADVPSLPNAAPAPLKQAKLDQFVNTGATYVPTSKNSTQRAASEDEGDVAAKRVKPSEDVLAEVSDKVPEGGNLRDQQAILDELNRKIEEQKKQLLSMAAQLGESASTLGIPGLDGPAAGAEAGEDSSLDNMKEIMGTIRKKEQELRKLNLMADPIVEKFGHLHEEGSSELSSKDEDPAEPPAKKSLQHSDSSDKDADTATEAIPLPPSECPTPEDAPASERYPATMRSYDGARKRARKPRNISDL